MFFDLLFLFLFEKDIWSRRFIYKELEITDFVGSLLVNEVHKMISSITH